MEPAAPVGSRCGEALEQRRYGGGLVRLGVDRLLSEAEAAGGGEGRDEVQRRRAGAAVVAASRSLAVDGDEVVTVGPGPVPPIGEAGREQPRLDPTHQDTQPPPTRHPVAFGDKTPAERDPTQPPGG